MKLKPTVALSIAVLGLASPIAYAAVGAANAQQADSKSRVARLEKVLDQNQGQAVSFGKLPMRGWERRITISGLANGDWTWSNRTPVTNSNVLFATSNSDNDQSYNDLGVANANLFIDAKVNNFSYVHAALGYWSGTQNVNAQPHAQDPNGVFLDEGYVYLHDFANSPLWARVGIQYTGSGFYERFPIAAPFTQMLSQNRATAATVGFNSAAGYNVSLFVANGSNKKSRLESRRRVNSGGVKAAYRGSMNDVNFNVGFSFMNNMADTDYVGQVGYDGAVGNGTDTTTLAHRYTKRVGVLAAHATVEYANFDLGLDFSGATSRFSPDDILAFGSATKGARPRAIHAGLGYSVPVMGRKSRVGISYEKSWDGVNLASSAISTAGINNRFAGLPEYRYGAQVDVELAKMTTLSLHLRKDKDYKTATNSGGTGLSATTGVLRVNVKFA